MDANAAPAGGAVVSTRVNLRRLAQAGTAAIARYTGVLFGVFLVQSVIATAVLVGVAVVLASAFAHIPLWDEAVDGDLAALVACLRFGSAHVLACAGIAFAALLLWTITSWFLVGGINGVLARRPEGRVETARCFGACGVATYLAYARLALWSLPNWFAVLMVFAACTSAAAPRLEHALTVGDLACALMIAVVPALILLHVFRTVMDYTRAELSLRIDSPQRSVVATYAATFGFVIRHPLTLLHAGLGWVGFAVVTLGYAYLAADHPMFGTEAAIALFIIRMGVSLARMAIRFGILAGQFDWVAARSTRPPSATTPHLAP